MRVVANGKYPHRRLWQPSSLRRWFRGARGRRTVSGQDPRPALKSSSAILLQDIALSRWQGHHRRPRHPLTNLQISDLGQPKKITLDKNNAVVEGRSKYDRLRY